MANRKKRCRGITPGALLLVIFAGLGMVLIQSRQEPAEFPVQIEAARESIPTDHTQGDLVLVNGEYAYDPEAVTELVTVYGNMADGYYVRDAQIRLQSQVLEALNGWLGEFYAQTGIQAVNVIAGYRRWEDQQTLRENALAQYGADHVAVYFQAPGHSEHHTGLAVDLGLYDPESCTSADFTGEGDYAWLLEHAWEYGFVQRYPTDKQTITGIAFESWHFRYVGVPHAWYMTEQDLVLEEYLELLRGYSADRPLTFRCQGTQWAVWYTRTPPTAGTVSGDNVDGYIVTKPER